MDNLVVFLASVHNRARHFSWHRLITVPSDDGTMQNLLTHYGQVSLDNTRAHAATYMNTLTRDAQDNDMFYYFLADSLMNDFRTMVLLYTDIYMVTNIPIASSLLKQIIILTRVDNPASMMHIDRIPSTNPGAEPPRDVRDSGSASFRFGTRALTHHPQL